MIPYIYKLKHIPTGKYYIGSQYGKNSNPKNLWNTYTTSSKYVQQLIEEDGIDSFIVIRVIPRVDAREYESKLLKRLYKKLGKDRFLEIMINRNVAPGILLTDEIIAKANIKRKSSCSIAAKKLIEQHNHNFQKFKAGEMEHVRKLRSERMIGNNLGSTRKITDEYRNKQALGATGNTNVRGTKWWNNGIINKRSRECPGDGFILGIMKGA